LPTKFSGSAGNYRASCWIVGQKAIVGQSPAEATCAYYDTLDASGVREGASGATKILTKGERAEMQGIVADNRLAESSN